MYEMKISKNQNVAGVTFTGIEGGFGEDKRAMLVKEIAAIHSKRIGNVNQRINDNRKRFIDGVDIIDLKNDTTNVSLETLGFSSRDISISKNIYILSERGYAKLLKILEDDKAWELYDILVDDYFNIRSQKPQSQLEILQASINQLVKQEQRLLQVETRMSEVKSEVQSIRDVVAINTSDWRKDTTNILNKIALKRGGYAEYQKVRQESYELLEARAKCKLSIRLTNMKREMLENGQSKSKVDKASKLDVIDRNTRLLEIYTAIVKEMAIKSGVA